MALDTPTRAPRVRRITPSIPVEPSEDTTPTKLVFENDGNDAMVTEQIGAKTVTYAAKVKEDETRSQNEDTEFLDDGETNFDYSEDTLAPPLPKTPLDTLFDDVLVAVERGSNDYFFAKLLRQPDSITDRFNVPCREIIDLGIIQFSTHDRFNLMPAIQETNGNSGGRFAISVYNADHTPLMISRGRSIHAVERQVGAPLLYIANPVAKPETVNGNGNGFESVLKQMVDMQQQNHNQLVQILSRPRETNQMEATIMGAVMQKMANDIVNPPQPQNNGNNLENTITSVMSSIAVTQAMADGIARTLNREPPATPEPDWIDKAEKIANMPIAQQLMGRIGDIGEALAVKGLNLPTDTTTEAELPTNATMPLQNNATNAQPEMTETQELITEILTELDSDNALNADNETIKELAEDFPDQYTELVAFCKNTSFEFLFERLTRQVSSMQPSPLFPYLNMEETQKQNKFVYNDAGVRLQGRLRDLYEYLKTTP